jgi:hypothetical protein
VLAHPPHIHIQSTNLPIPARFHAINETTVDAWVKDSSGADVTKFLDSSSVSSGRKPVPGGAAEEDDGAVHNLFAFPAEDNFAGGWSFCGGRRLGGGGVGGFRRVAGMVLFAQKIQFTHQHAHT